MIVLSTALPEYALTVPKRHTDDKSQERHKNRYQYRRTHRMQQTAEIVSANVIRTQPVLRIGGHTDLFKILVQVVVGRQVRPGNCCDISEENDDQADQGQTVAQQSPERIAPQSSLPGIRPVKLTC